MLVICIYGHNHLETVAYNYLRELTDSLNDWQKLEWWRVFFGCRLSAISETLREGNYLQALHVSTGFSDHFQGHRTV